MHRRDLVRALARSVPDQNNVVVYPDHPLVVRGPDVLARVDGTLVAYFVFAVGDPRPAAVAGHARILLSRLALPEGTEFVLVCESRTPDLRDEDVALFDAIGYGRAFGRSYRAGLEPSGFAAGGVIAELRPFHMRRFGDAWAMREQNSESRLLTPDAESRRRAGAVPISMVSGRAGRRRPRVSAILGVDEGVIYASSSPVGVDRAAEIRRIGQWICAAVDLDYPSTPDSLSDAVSALHAREAYLPLHQARTGPMIEGVASDILKPYRAAAFAGFHTIVGGA